METEVNIKPAPNQLEPDPLCSVVNLREWAENLDSMQESLPYETYHAWIPVHCAQYLEPVLTGYMTGPVGFYDGQPLSARSVKVDNIEEFRATLAGIGKPVFLYTPIWIPSQYVFKTINESGDVVDCDPPQYIEGFWKIRYAVAED